MGHRRVREGLQIHVRDRPGHVECRPERPHRGERPIGLVQRTEPTGDDRHHRLHVQGTREHRGEQRQLVGRVAAQLGVGGEDPPGVRGRPHERPAEDDRTDRVQRQLERGGDPEVPAAAPQRPEQIGMLPLVHAQVLTVGGDQIDRLQVVARQAVDAREPADAAAEGEAADAGVRDRPAGRGQTERLRLPVDVGPQRAAGDPHRRSRRIDMHTAHRREVDHQRTVGDRSSGHVVTAAADRHQHVLLASEPHRRHHVGRARTAHDRPRSPVDGAVPHRVDVVERGVGGRHHLAADRRCERAPRRLIDSHRVPAQRHEVHVQPAPSAPATSPG